MNANNSDTALIELVLKVMEPSVRKVASISVRKRASFFTESDREDIEQMLRLAIIHAIPKFDPKRGQIEPFFSRVIQNRMKEIYRERHTRHQDRISLSIVVSCEEPEPGCISEECIKVECRESNDTWDMEDIVDSMPPVERDACKIIMDGDADSLRSVAVKLGINRTTFRRKHLPSIIRTIKMSWKK